MKRLSKYPSSVNYDTTASSVSSMAKRPRHKRGSSVHLDPRLRHPDHKRLQIKQGIHLSTQNPESLSYDVSCIGNGAQTTIPSDVHEQKMKVLDRGKPRVHYDVTIRPYCPIKLDEKNNSWSNEELSCYVGIRQDGCPSLP